MASKGSGCDHTTKGNRYYKRTIRRQGEYTPLDFLFSGGVKWKLEQPCELCNIVYPFWMDHARQRGIWVGDREFEGTTTTVDPETKTLDPMVSQSPGVVTSKITLKLNSKEYGEAYYALICHLLRPEIEMHVKVVETVEEEERCEEGANKDKAKKNDKKKEGGLKQRFAAPFKGTKTTKSEQKTEEEKKKEQNAKETQGIWALLRWYDFSLTSSGETPDSQKIVTKMICDSFRKPNRSAVGKQSSSAQHTIASENLRQRLDGEISARSLVSPPTQHASSSVNLLHDYYGPESQAKITHEEEVSRVKRVDNTNLLDRYFSPSWAAKYWLNRYLRLTNQSTLPKPGKVSRLAVIHVRRSPRTTIGLLMDKKNLQHVAQSIAHANSKSVECGEVKADRFSHVMLYGDFSYDEGLEFKKDVVEELGEEVDVSFISGPWRHCPDATGMEAKVNELWGRFRDITFDGIPTQVKVLGIWTALCKRYKPRMCVIGFRSGFVEGAAFVGIPTFYLNNERDKIKNGWDRQAGELLWNPVENTELAGSEKTPNRRRDLANNINTFIPVEVLTHEEVLEKGRNGKPDKTIWRVGKRYQDELGAALFMYMCCNVQGSIPAWAARVDLMHDAGRGASSGDGWDWLCSRYRFATGKAAGGSGEALPDWSGKARDRWYPDFLDTSGYDAGLAMNGLRGA